MKTSKVLVLVVVIAVAGSSQAQRLPRQSERVAGTKVSMTPPADFTPSTQFPGFWLESLGCSIMVTELPGSYAQLSTGFSNISTLMKRGMSLLHKQPVTVGGRRALLMNLQQNAYGREFLKWLLMFGDESESVMLVATFPKELEAEFSPKMKASILTARWERDKAIVPSEGLRFMVSEKGELKLSKRVANLLAFTKGGIFPSTHVDDPVFIIGQSFSKIDIDNPEEFAKARILQTAQITDVKIEESNKITIDDLDGYEIVANAKDKASGRAIMIYQVVLFERQNYFLMQGLVGSKNRQPNLELFKQMAVTFKRTKL